MKKSIVTVKTITIGLKAKKILSGRGIKSSLIKIDHTKSQNGCQYGLEFNEQNFYEVVSALREYGIEYGVYEPK